MTGKKIKIALCLSGEPRSSMFCFPYIYESFINLGPEYEVDVYIHSWKGFRALNLYNPKNFKIDFTDEDQFFREITTNLIQSNTSLKFKDFWESKNNYTIHSNNVKNLFLMFYSLRECFNLIKEPYDIFIRSRIDLIFQHPFSIHNSIKNIINQNADLYIPFLNVPQHGYNKSFTYKTYDDQYAIGNYKAMNAYFNTFNNLGSLINEVDNLNAVFLLSKNLHNHNLNIFDLPNPTELVRKSTVITNLQTPNFIYLDE